jgi:hypothetical protein
MDSYVGTTLTPWQETGGPGNGGGFVERISDFTADGLNPDRDGI